MGWKEQLPVITNIQKYSIHDGPGIRTTVFLKGCPLSCLWCHNPETQKFAPEEVWYEERCVGCGKCQEGCYHNARERLDRQEPAEQLAKLLLRDQAFYEESGGGVTLSGGEVMVQNVDYLAALMKKLHRAGVSVMIDTCGFAPFANFEKLLPWTDAWLYDIKWMDPDGHRRCTGQDNRLILENLCRLSQAGQTIYLRLPLIAGLNDSRKDMEAVIRFLQDNHILPAKIHLLPYHDIGKDKYRRLNRTYEGDSFLAPSGEHLEELQQLFAKSGFGNCQIGG
ncbi:MAG: glycyl-radical enzyme activating protein [Lachnospiraceae bacterium]|nr:glycyl-radical enzyme activating protein [Lachnospiraceae bacterium]